MDKGFTEIFYFGYKKQFTPRENLLLESLYFGNFKIVY